MGQLPMVHQNAVDGADGDFFHAYAAVSLTLLENSLVLWFPVQLLEPYRTV